VWNDNCSVVPASSLSNMLRLVPGTGHSRGPQNQAAAVAGAFAPFFALSAVFRRFK